MRRHDKECTSIPSGSSGDNTTRDNAFSPELFDELHRREPEPPVPEAELPGPWRVTRLWGDGPPLWAVYGFGEHGPRLTFDTPEMADAPAGRSNLPAAPASPPSRP